MALVFWIKYLDNLKQLEYQTFFHVASILKIACMNFLTTVVDFLHLPQFNCTI